MRSHEAQNKSPRLRLTLRGRLVVPDGPELHGEERRPADDVGHHDDHGHLHSLHPGFGHASHGAGPGGQRLAHRHPVVVRLHAEVEVNGAADAHLAHGHGENRQDENHQSGPADVGSQSPRLDELRPAVVHPRSHLHSGEDEDLREAADQRDAPRRAHRRVAARAAPLERHHGFADGLIAIDRHHHDHVRGRKHPDNLQVLHQTAQHIWTDEAVGDVPQQLRAHLEEGNHQVGHAQVEDEDAHPGELLPPPPQHHEDAEVQDSRSDEDDGEEGDFHLSQTLIPRLVSVKSIGPSGVTGVYTGHSVIPGQ